MQRRLAAQEHVILKFIDEFKFRKLVGVRRRVIGYMKLLIVLTNHKSHTSLSYKYLLKLPESSSHSNETSMIGIRDKQDCISARVVDI